jgi:hypothetical protein
MRTQRFIPKTITATLVLVAAGILGAGPARADYSVSIRIANSVIRDTSFDAVSEDDHLVQAEIGFARTVVELWEGILWVEGAYMGGAVRAPLFSGDAEASPELGASIQSATLGVRYDYPVFYWLVPYLRLGMGVGFGSLELNDTQEGTVKDWAASFRGHILAGVELLWPRRALRLGQSSLAWGLLIEAGYGFGSKLGFDLRPEEDEELREIPLTGGGLGGLSVNGAQLRIGAVLRF